MSQQDNNTSNSSRRARRALFAAACVLAVLVICLGYFIFEFYEESSNAAAQQLLLNRNTAQTIVPQEEGEEEDSLEIYSKKTSAPDLVGLVGKQQEEAMDMLADYGAAITGTKKIKEEDNPIKTRVSIALTNEPGDSRSGTPTVYLGLDEDGVIYMAGYSAAISSLGYSSISFADAIYNGRVVENTLIEAGLPVLYGAVVLPYDKAEYSKYASDGVTLVKENCSFEGEATRDEKAYHWSATLMYDYTPANQSGNLIDTTRQISVYITAL